VTMRIEMLDDAGYRPGACNIGPEELARRRQAAIAGTVVLAAAAIAIVALGLPAVARWAILPVAIGTAVAWEQALRRFCVAYGTAGVQNFGPIGAALRVADPDAARADRAKALRMIGEAVAIGLVVTVVFAALPI
jgi:hypothetical protein